MARPLDSGKRVPRFFCEAPLSSGMLRELPAAAAHHAARVLRLKADDTVKLFCGDDTEWHGVITGIERDRVWVRVIQAELRGVESPLYIALAQGMSSREKMDLTLQKATELGISEIFPIVTQRSVIKLSDERAGRRVEHWQGVVSAACEQCGRNKIPVIHGVQRFDRWLAALPRTSPDLRLLLSPAGSIRLKDIAPPSRILLLVGPEGGLTPEEREPAQGFGFQAMVLGPRVLRTETAALAAVAAMHALWGDF
ncbi:MAG: 16S rRNA (uracil(1498)-N(3))-methyltransferase [Betaproteobacteria bacterium]|nr:16S rRNA (uracil(1498)-N(3))-methyltransferase [Betaproteobacteria bacterium]